MTGGEPDAWGPEHLGGHRFRLARRLLRAFGLLALVGAVALSSTGFLLYRQAESNLTRVELEELDQDVESSDARNFLVVGSDARQGIDPEERDELSFGDFEGQRSDTIMYVSVSADREHVSLISFPRDLLVRDGTRQDKITNTFAGGADNLVRVIRENFGLSVNHYANVSLGGFLDVVRTLGGVELCLEEPLVDSKSGADLPAGCQQLTPEEALSFVRSRQGQRADFARIDRQQQFLRGALEELIDARVLADVPRLYQLVEDVAGNVTTDEQLGVAEMRGLAGELRDVVRQGVPMTTVPAYPRTIDGIDYVIAYGPGARSMFEDVRAGRPLDDRGTRQQRDETRVALWSTGLGRAATLVNDTLVWAGFDTARHGAGPESLRLGETTAVYRLPGAEDEAEWVGGLLGAPVEELPPDVEAPEDVDVVVAAGEDATT